jgi:MamI restriction endonuclease
VSVSVRVPNESLMSGALLASSTEEILRDLFVSPRAAVRKWAEVTEQTAQAKTAYLGQHLASVLTGIPGAGTAARGHDLIDGSEVKTCSRADQLGSCKKCDAPVPAWRIKCGSCGSTEIKRKTDSHWLFAIQSEAELDQLKTLPRVLFILMDRTHNNNDIRIRAWEVWPEDASHAYFVDFARDYYENNYLVKSAKAAPANLHPLKFDFLMMNPVRTLDARLIEVDKPTASIEIDEHFDPRRDRDEAPVEPMPPSLCKPDEIRALISTAPTLIEGALAPGKSVADLDAAARKKGAKFRAAADAALPDIPPTARLLITMRSKRIKTSETTYRRRGVGS